MSVAETLAGEVLTRLLEDPLSGVAVANIRRAHRTPVTRDMAPAVHVIDGDAKPTADKSCAWAWQFDLTVSVMVRDDAGYTGADPLVCEVVARINPELDPPYSHKARLELLTVRKDTEIADGDAVRVDIELRFKFGTAPWSLEAVDA